MAYSLHAIDVTLSPHAVPRWLVCSESSYLLGLGGIDGRIYSMTSSAKDTEYSVPFESQPLLFVAVTS